MTTHTSSAHGAHAGTLVRVTDGVFLVRTLLSNVAFISTSGGADTRWVLVDAGVRGYGPAIVAAAEQVFGPGTAPEAIVLTHGHFDHVGSLDALLRHWDVPVFAHHLELPHLTARLDYPPPDPLAGGGLMAWSARAFPRGAIDVGPRLLALPPDGSVPGVTGWTWMHTPGHTAGHVSLFREADRTLVSGDAVITVKQESFTAVLTDRRGVYGPPAYFTSDWDAARESVRYLALMRPEAIAPGHGRPMYGEALRSGLDRLARQFDRVARPKHGRYAHHPAVAGPGRSYDLPPDPLPKVLGGAVAGAALGVLVVRALNRRTS